MAPTPAASVSSQPRSALGFCLAGRGGVWERPKASGHGDQAPFRDSLTPVMRTLSPPQGQRGAASLPGLGRRGSSLSLVSRLLIYYTFVHSRVSAPAMGPGRALSVTPSSLSGAAGSRLGLRLREGALTFVPSPRCSCCRPLLCARAVGLDAQEAGRRPPQPLLTSRLVSTPDSVPSHARGDMRPLASVSVGAHRSLGFWERPWAERPWRCWSPPLWGCMVTSRTAGSLSC